MNLDSEEPLKNSLENKSEDNEHNKRIDWPKKIFLELSIERPVTTRDKALTCKFDWSVEKKFDQSSERPVAARLTGLTTQ